jgi:hypothetical protein
MPRDQKNITNELEEEGQIKETLSFDTIIKLMEGKDDETRELVEAMPSLPALLRHVHKHAFWAGAEFGRISFIKISEDESITEDLDEEY